MNNDIERINCIIERLEIEMLELENSIPSNAVFGRQAYIVYVELDFMLMDAKEYKAVKQGKSECPECGWHVKHNHASSVLNYYSILCGHCGYVFVNREIIINGDDLTLDVIQMTPEDVYYHKQLGLSIDKDES